MHRLVWISDKKKKKGKLEFWAKVDVPVAVILDCSMDIWGHVKLNLIELDKLILGVVFFSVSLPSVSKIWNVYVRGHQLY